MAKPSFPLHPETQVHTYHGMSVRFRYADDNVYIAMIDAQNLLMCRYSAKSVYEVCNTPARIQFFANPKNTLIGILASDLYNLCKANGNRTPNPKQEEKIQWVKSVCDNIRKQYEPESTESSDVLRIFNNPEFGDIRTYMDETNEALFCATDICKALGYSNGRDAIAKHVDEGDVAKRDTPTLSGIQSMTFVNESGLYALIFGSKLDTAKKFKHWVTSEVLPSIRKHGAYITSSTLDKMLIDPDFGIKLLETLKAEREAKELAQAEVERSNQLLATQNGCIKRMQPKEEYYDVVVTERETYTTCQLASELGVSYPTLRKALYNAGIIVDKCGKITPKPEYENWMVHENMPNSRQKLYKWTKEGRDGIFSKLAPQMPK